MQELPSRFEKPNVGMLTRSPRAYWRPVRSKSSAVSLSPTAKFWVGTQISVLPSQFKIESNHGNCPTSYHLLHNHDRPIPTMLPSSIPNVLLYILVMKANEMHYFLDLFDKLIHVFRTGPLSIISSISTLYTQQ